MEKRLNILVSGIVLALLILAAGCMGGMEVSKTTEEVDQSTRIVSTIIVEDLEKNYTQHELQYIKDEKLYEMPFPDKLRPSLDYLRENAAPSDKILSWWDNGHIIRGYARRDPIVYTPAYSILDSVRGNEWDVQAYGEFSTDDDLMNVAYALLADSPAITSSIMRRYGADWIYVTKMDQKKVFGMALILGENLENYLDELGDPKATVRHKVLFKMADGWSVKGFEMMYEDDYAYVYKLK